MVPPSQPISEYVERFESRWHVVHPPAPVEWRPPRNLGSEAIVFDLPATSSEYGVLELHAGLVYGVHGWVFGANGAMLPELSWYGGPNDRIRIPDPLPKPVHLGGVCLSLVSDWSCRNYSHFLLDGLGRLALFLATGLSLSDVDHVYCPMPPTPVVAHYFDRLGIPPTKRVWAASSVVVEADTLFVPSLPSTALTYPDWLPAFLRRALVRAPAAKPARRLYVSRRGYGRHAVTEHAVERMLVERGFEIYEAAEQPDQPDDFDQAEIVVGPHGAGLANLAFCRPGTRVVEIVPTDNAHPFYYSLSSAARLDYCYLVGRSLVNRHPDEFGPSPYDFDIDLDALATAVA